MGWSLNCANGILSGSSLAWRATSMASGQIAPIATFKTEKRAIPTITLISNSVLVNVSNTAFDNISTLGARLIITATAAGTTSLMSLYSAAAEL